jgi:hypothetical protein
MSVLRLEAALMLPTGQSPGERLTWGRAGRLARPRLGDDAVALVPREVEQNVQVYSDKLKL